jgi:hypothetical protein
LSKRKAELRLLPPRCVLPPPEMEREAVALLAELLLDAGRKRRGVRSGGGFDGVMGGASGGVASLPDESARARRAA